MLFQTWTTLRYTGARGKAISRTQILAACPLNGIMSTFGTNDLPAKRGSCLHGASLSPCEVSQTRGHQLVSSAELQSSTERMADS